MSVDTQEFTLYMEPLYFEAVGSGAGPYSCLTSIETKAPEDDIALHEIEAKYSVIENVYFDHTAVAKLSKPYSRPYTIKNQTNATSWVHVYYTFVDPKSGHTVYVSTSTETWDKDKERLSKALGHSQIPFPNIYTFVDNQTVRCDSYIIKGYARISYLTHVTLYLQELAAKLILEPIYYTVPMMFGTYDPNSYEHELIMLPIGKDPLDCLSCYSFENPWRTDKAQRKRLEDLTAKLNWYRSIHPDLCTPDCQAPLLSLMLSGLLDNYLVNVYTANMNNTLKEWYFDPATDTKFELYPMIENQYDHPLMFMQALFCEEKWTKDPDIDPKDYPPEQPDYTSIDAFTERCLSSHAGATSSEDSIYRPEAKIVGMGIKQFTHVRQVWEGAGYKYKQYTDYRNMMVIFYMWGDDIESSFDEIPVPDHVCGFTCVEELKWYQQYHETMGLVETGASPPSPQFAFQMTKVPEPFIHFPLKVPQICAMEAIVFVTETRGVQAILRPGTDPLPIPEDNSLKYNWPANWDVIWPSDTVATYLIPGEQVAFYILVRANQYCGMQNPVEGYKIPAGSTKCCYFMWSYGWFETKCLTSGFVDGVGRLNQAGAVIEGGIGAPWKSSYTSRDDVFWHVNFKGFPYWVRPSDYAQYKIDPAKRVFIYKSGVEVIKGSVNQIRKGGCRSRGMPAVSDSPLSYSDVSYKLERTSDCVIPGLFFDLGEEV